jgi:hypothetical protein
VIDLAASRYSRPALLRAFSWERAKFGACWFTEGFDTPDLKSAKGLAVKMMALELFRPCNHWCLARPISSAANPGKATHALEVDGGEASITSA